MKCCPAAASVKRHRSRTRLFAATIEPLYSAVVRTAAILLVLGIASGCTTHLMSVDQKLAPHGPVPIAASEKEGSHAINIGDFIVLGIKEGHAAGITAGSLVTRKQEFSFQLIDDESVGWQCDCTVQLKAARGHVKGGSGIVSMECEIKGIELDPYFMRMSGLDTRTRRRTGNLAIHDVSGNLLEVHSSNTLDEGKAPDGAIVGYVVTAKDVPVAAVQTFDVNQLWLDKSVPHPTRSLAIIAAMAATFFDRVADGESGLRW